MKKTTSEEQIVRHIEKLVLSIEALNPERIVLLGSTARGNYTVHSDSDMR